MTFSFTTREAPATAAENRDHPFPKATAGFSWKSAREGAAAEVRLKAVCCEGGGGEGVLPNPW
jgi:hypothetical protein